MSNYPEGSMRGSGIYADEREMTQQCDSETCLGEQREGTLFIDDWQHGTWQCGTCGWETDLDADYDEPDYDDRDDSIYD